MPTKFFDTEVEPKQRIPQQELDNLYNQIRVHDDYPMESTKTRNVLIVGRTRSGKSTAVGVLKDPCHEPKEMSIFSDTVDPKFQSFSLDNKITSVKYTLNFIDTPGLKEVKKIGEDARSDAVILNTINYCLKNEITKINCLLIFISFELGVTQDDLDSFQTFLEKFNHKDIRVGICITRAEDKSEKWQSNIIGQLQQHAYFSNVLASPNVKVVFMGCVDGVKNETIGSIEDAKRLYFRVYRMREKLVQLIFDAEDSAKLIELPIAAGIKSNVMETFAMQDQILSFLEGQDDFDLATVKLKIDEFAINVDAIAHHEGILTDEEMHNKFVQMRNRMVPVASKIRDDNLRAKFAGKVILK